MIIILIDWQAYSDYLGFVITLNDAVKGKPMTADCHVSEVICILIVCVNTQVSPNNDCFSPRLHENAVNFTVNVHELLSSKNMLQDHFVWEGQLQIC